jgi:SanA protein
MKNYLTKEGVPENILLLDHSGLNTFETCRRAKEVLKLDKVILITQKYHLNRALYDCNQLGMAAIGVEASNGGYPKQWQYSLREIPASIIDFWKLIFKK